VPPEPGGDFRSRAAAQEGIEHQAAHGGTCGDAIAVVKLPMVAKKLVEVAFVATRLVVEEYVGREDEDEGEDRGGDAAMM
jgi:hypothetical protein